MRLIVAAVSWVWLASCGGDAAVSRDGVVADTGTMPEDTSTGTTPEDTSTSTMPEDTSTSTMPEDTSTSTMPEDTSTSTMPEDTSASTSTTPEDTSTSTTPEDTSTSTMPEDTSTSAMPEDASAWVRPPRPDTDHPGPGDGWRWGGGAGYPDVVDPTWPVVTRVADLAALEAALAAAAPGDVVWVEGGAAIDVTGRSLCVPGGVWLASDRGVAGAPGGLLFATAGAAAPVIAACGDDVRVTGLRLRGPDPESCPPEWPSHCPNDVSGDVNCAYCTTTAYGIGALGHDRLEVDNCELSGWTYAAVGVKDGVDADVHHDHIHHGWRMGLGYGVVLYGQGATSALVRWNRFDAMRHVVAGQGYAHESYEARDNLVGPAAIGHVFDMHGQDEAADDGSPNAGDDIRVHDNIVLVADQYSMVIRGRPVTGSWLWDNCLAPAKADAADQRYFSGHFHVDVDPTGAAAPNDYGQSPSGCGTLRWCLRDAAVGPERYGSASGTPASALLVGDLDGDGRDDVFGTTGAAWRYANPNGGSWTALASSGAALSDLALADLDGDGRADVFSATGTTWRWSKSGTTSWADLRASTLRRSEVRFGDFDGDGAADVFTTDGARWSYYPKGSGAPVALASSGAALAALALGDLDGDGVTDVFWGDGARWRWSRSGRESWADLASSGATVAELALADLDGDRVDDVVSVAGETLRVSWGGRTSWVALRHQREGLGELRLGDFDGDGRADVLVGGCL